MFAIHGTSIGFGKRPFETPDHWPLRMSQTGTLEGWIDQRLFERFPVMGKMSLFGGMENESRYWIL
jgi:hypothetical protein